MREFRIKLKNGVVCAVYPGGDKGVVVLGSGLPQYIQKYNPFVKEVIDAGYTLIVPRYKGTWESDGDFNLSGAIETIESAVEVASSGKAVELYAGQEITWNTNKIITIGYSFGALPVLKSNYSSDIKTLLICPFLSMKFQEGGEDVVKSLQFIKDAYPNVYRFSMEELSSDLNSPELPEEKNNLSVVRGLQDTAITDETYDFIKKQYGVDVEESDMGHSLVFRDDF